MITKHGTITITPSGALIVEGFAFDTTDGRTPKEDLAEYFAQIVYKHGYTYQWTSGYMRQRHEQ